MSIKRRAGAARPRVWRHDNAVYVEVARVARGRQWAQELDRLPVERQDGGKIGECGGTQVHEAGHRLS
jgi:hypothetical protein